MPTVLQAPARVLVTAVIALAAAIVSAAPSVAHTELRSSDPAEGATVETLDTVTLEFSSDILDIGAELAVVDAAGDTHDLEPAFPTADSVSAPVDVTLPAGATVVQWRIVAEDGHPIEGEIAFTFAPAEQADAAPSPSATPSPISAEVMSSSPSPSPSAVLLDGEGGLIATAPTASPSPTASPADDADGGAQPWIWMVVAVAVVGTAAAALIAQSRRR